jgi:hypothetical protein
METFLAFLWIPDFSGMTKEVFQNNKKIYTGLILFERYGGFSRAGFHLKFLEIHTTKK